MTTPRKERFRKERSKRRFAAKVGSEAGTLVADPQDKVPEISVFAYDGLDLIEERITDPVRIKDLLGKGKTVWINVEGLGDVNLLQYIGNLFGIHHLALEDVMNVHQRAKLEQYGDHYFIVARMVDVRFGMETEQLSIFCGDGFVVTFQEGPIDSLDPVRERLRKKQGQIRTQGADYLAYAILDAVIDSYFPILEDYGERLEALEDAIIDQPKRELVSQIHEIKRDLIGLRRSIWPLREAINSLLRDAPPMFQPETRLHLRDCYDHCVQIIDFIETYRELGADLMDVYLSSISNRMNEVMKVLTIITTFFVPPTLVAGIYGMNFREDKSPLNMPELSWYYGYPFALGLMFLCVVATLILLRWKGWLGALIVTHHPKDPNR